VSAGLGCSLRCTPILSVTHSTAAAAVRSLWHHASDMCLPRLETHQIDTEVKAFYCLFRSQLRTSQLAGDAAKHSPPQFVAESGGFHHHCAGLALLVTLDQWRLLFVRCVIFCVVTTTIFTLSPSRSYLNIKIDLLGFNVTFTIRLYCVLKIYGLVQSLTSVI